MRVIESSALDVLLACSLEAATLGAASQAKDRLIVKALHGPAEPEGVTVIVLAVEVKFTVKGRGVFQEARILLIVGAEARIGHIGVGNERQNLQRQRAEAAEAPWVGRCLSDEEGPWLDPSERARGRARRFLRESDGVAAGKSWALTFPWIACNTCIAFLIFEEECYM